MPNWVDNILVIGHPDKEMQKRLLGAYRRGKLGQEFVPMPDEYLKDDRWHDWRNVNWGTKWDMGEGQYGRPPGQRGDKLELRFDTAWSPPFALYLELHRLGFDIDASYYEANVAGCGRILNNDHRGFGIDCWNPVCVRRFIDPDLVERFAIDDSGHYDEEDDPCDHGDEPWLETDTLDQLVAGYRDLHAAFDQHLSKIAGKAKQP